MEQRNACWEEEVERWQISATTKNEEHDVKNMKKEGGAAAAM